MQLNTDLYKLKFNTDSKPKSGKLTRWVEPQDYNIDEIYSYNKSRQGFILDNELRLPLLEKLKGNVLEDYLLVESLSTFFMIISKKALIKISKYNIPEYKLYELCIKENANFEIYYTIHFNQHLTQNIVDWNTSTFSIKPRGYKKVAIKSGITFESYDHYLYCKQETASSHGYEFTLVKEKIFYDKTVFTKYDLIYAIGPVLGYYCSSKFAEAINNSDLKGFEFDGV